MSWTIPGTVLTAAEKDGAAVEAQFRAMFLPGGMVLSQVSAITGLESYTIQNWVKRGFLTNPDRKHYSLRQLCRIININMLKGVLPLPDICSLLGYVNGQLDNEADDMIDDSDLYFMFVRLAARSRELYKAENRDTVLDQELSDYQEPVPGAKQRVKEVLRIMLTAWLAARMAQETTKMLNNLKERND
jgi:DNA-binding transcriptional MerR regulator